MKYFSLRSIRINFNFNFSSCYARPFKFSLNTSRQFVIDIVRLDVRKNPSDSLKLFLHAEEMEEGENKGWNESIGS